jgi:hypothetical protein
MEDIDFFADDSIWRKCQNDLVQWQLTITYDLKTWPFLDKHEDFKAYQTSCLDPCSLCCPLEAWSETKNGRWKAHLMLGNNMEISFRLWIWKNGGIESTMRTIKTCLLPCNFRSCFKWSWRKTASATLRKRGEFLRTYGINHLSWLLSQKG